MRMLLKSWDELPDFIKSEEVKKYYDILSHKKASLILKRVYDIVASLVLVILLSPIFIILSIWIKLDSNGPIFYRQERVTQYGQRFRIYKFRTMVMNADKSGELITIENDSRITKVGRKIRKCRLDEVPQLINVILGDMSLVGTRPEVSKYVDAYTNEMKATLLLPAGVTSFASLKFRDEDMIINNMIINGKSADQAYIDDVLPRKMMLNLRYILNFHFYNDVYICIKTIFHK